MALFRFKVSDRQGRVSEQTVESESRKEASKRLQHRGLVLLEFLGEGDSASVVKKHFWERERFNADMFTERLVPLLDAGIPIEKSLLILADSSENPQEARILNDLRRGLHEGRKLSKLIRDRGRLFPPMYSNIVEAGEESGALPKVMAQLQQFMTDMREFRSFLITSSVYPAVVSVVCVIALAVILGWIVPQFKPMFENSTREPNFWMSSLLQVSDFVQSYWWTLPLALVVLIVLWLIPSVQQKMKNHWDRLVLKLPLFRKVAIWGNLSRFLRTLGVLIESGVHLLDSVSIASRVIQNHTIRDSLNFISNDLRRGEKLSVSLAKSPLVPNMVIRMVSVGEETGQPAEMMGRVAHRYEVELRALLKQVISLFEPLMIVMLALIVGSIMLILFMSLMSMQNLG